MSLIIGIETSGPESFVVVADTITKKMTERKGISRDSHSEELAVLLNDVLKTLNEDPKHISDIIVGTGPGSFTGLRIGMSFAKGLSYALQVPLHGISSLLVAAYSVREKGSLFGAISDARRDEYFTGLYTVDKDILEAIAPAIKSKEKFFDEISCLSSEDVALSSWEGSGLLPHIYYPERLGESMVHLFQNYPSVLTTVAPSASSLGTLDIEYLRPVAALTIAERAAGK